MLEAPGEGQGGLGGAHAGGADLRAEDARAVRETCGADIADRRGDAGGEGRGAQVEAGEQLGGEVDAHRQQPRRRRPGGLAPLRGPGLGRGERGLQLPRQGGLADPAIAVEDDDVAPRGFEVLDVEAVSGHVGQVLGERGREARLSEITGL
ncbi:hypothetical protein ACGFZP_33415 [Kitasatospora sp. NPDC048239]|uniref:hypothetical protein n=1 Tax=Kitasatospora sp. NPDC048239 TaxID=3364046 RepID=UPI003715F081